MKITQQNVSDLERSISDLVQKKEALILSKKEIEMENSLLKSRVRVGGKMSQHKYNAIVDEQNQLKRNQLKIEKDLSELSINIMKKSVLLDEMKCELKIDTIKSSGIKSELISLKDYYINFAADRTRVSSMRATAAEFVEKLEIIIKKINP